MRDKYSSCILAPYKYKHETRSTRQVHVVYLNVYFTHAVCKIDDFTCTADKGSSESRRRRFSPPTGSLGPRSSPTSPRHCLSCHIGSARIHVRSLLILYGKYPPLSRKSLLCVAGL